jgi:hypothetical protein
MVGYVLMDGFDYKSPNTLSRSLAASIYVILAGVFVVSSIFQLLSIYYMHSSTPRYYIIYLIKSEVIFISLVHY